MQSLRETVMHGHEQLRQILRDLLVHAARACDGDLHAGRSLDRDVDELNREIVRHARMEDSRMVPLMALLDGDFERVRAALDGAHAREEAAAAELRAAGEMDEVLLHVGDLVTALEWEERELGYSTSTPTAA